MKEYETLSCARGYNEYQRVWMVAVSLALPDLSSQGAYQLKIISARSSMRLGGSGGRTLV